MKKLLLAIFSLAFFAITASAQTSGKCGDNLTYELSNDGVLTITGTGKMNSYAFWRDDIKSLIKTVIIEEGATSIGMYAFYECSSITSVVIPSSVTNIEERAFRDCRSLASVTIPEGVTSIGYAAFHYCSSLDSIDIPASVTSIGDQTFTFCNKLEAINVDEANTSYSSLDGVLFNKDKTEIIKYPHGKPDASYSIPASVTTIRKNSFTSISALTSITIPSSVTSIGDYALSGCYRLGYIKSYATSPAEGYANTFSGITSSIPVYIPKTIIDNNPYTSVTGWSGFTNYLAIEDYWCGDDLFYTIADSVLTITGTGEMYDKAFKDNTSIKSVVIEEGATSIGTQAFQRCSSLTSITIPKSVTSLGKDAFSGCSSLASIIIPEGVTSISDYAFFNCSSLTSINLSEGLTSIGVYAFNGCSSLASIDIPASVKSIESNAFANCSSLTSINLSEGLTSIGVYAFYGCSSLKSISIPSSVTGIGSNVFDNCSKLEAINVNAENAIFNSSDGVLFAKDDTELMLYKYPEGKADASYSIPSGVTSIERLAVSSCSALVSINIPSSVTTIGDYAIGNCSSLSSINISEGVKSIGAGAFSSNTALTSITIPSSVTNIGSYAFSECSKLEFIKSYAASPASCTTYTFDELDSDMPVYVPKASINTYKTTTGWSYFTNYLAIEDYWCGDNLTYTLSDEGVLTITGTGDMYDNAFKDNTTIKSVVIDEGAASIGASAFSGCTSLTSITIPNGIASIGESAFSGCTSLASIDIPASVTSIGNQAFYDCYGLKSITVANENANYSSADGVLFDKDKTELIKYPEGKSGASYSIPESVTSIEAYAFYGCNTLTSITIPKKISSIGGYAFYGCSSLATIIIPESVTNIGDYAFYGCSKLKYIISKSTNPARCASSTFERVDASIPVYIPQASIDNKAYTSATGWSYFTNYLAIEDYWCGDNLTYELSADSVLSITGTGDMYDNAFEKRDDIKSVVIKEGATSIGANAFSYCVSITSVTIPESVKSIGNYAFKSCTALASINIPSGVTSIGNNAFNGCSSLASIDIPASVASIGDNAFYGCSMLASITVDEANANYSSADGVLFNKDKTMLIWYPKGKAGASYSIPASVTDIGSNAFSYCESITSVTIPESVTSIGTDAFYGCTALERIISSATNPAECSASTFEGVTSTIPVYVPEASISTYANAEGWKHFTNFKSIETSVDETAAEALVVTAKDGYVSVNAEEFAIMDLAGVDVTTENGSLSGVYLVKAGTEVVKVMVR